MSKNLRIGVVVDTTQAEESLARLRTQAKETLEYMQRMAKATGNFGIDPAVMKEAVKMLQTMNKELAGIERTTREMTRVSREGFTGLRHEIEHTRQSTVGLQWSLQGILKDAVKLANFQSRWYLARTAVFAVPGAIGAGAGFESEIDKAQATLLRYSAMEGEVTATHRRNVEEIVTYSRQIAVNLPVAFEEVTKSADRLMAAGVKLETVKASLESLTKLQVAFPEVNPEKFTNALVGFLNTYRNTPGLKEFANDAERIGAILDKLTVGLSKGVIAPGDLPLVIQHLGQMGAAAGFSIDQITALSVMTTNLGSKAGPAARALRGLIDSLSSTKSLDNLEKIGIHLDRNKTLAEQFTKIIDGLRKAVGTGTEGLNVGSMEFLRGIAPTERRSALIALLRALEEYNELVKDISRSQGALDRTAAVMTDTLSGQWQILKNITRELGAAFSNSELLKGGLTLLIGTLKTLGFLLSGIAGVTSLAVDGFKFLWSTIRLLTNPFERIVMSIGYVLSGDFKGALRELLRMPAVMDEQIAKGTEALTGSLDRAIRETTTIQDVLFGKSKFSGGTDPSKGGTSGTGVPEDNKEQYKDLLRDVREHERHLARIYELGRQIKALALSERLKESQANRTKETEHLDYLLKTQRLSIEEFYKQKTTLRQQDIAGEIESVQKTTQALQGEIDSRIQYIRDAMKKMSAQDLERARNEITELLKRKELITAQEAAKIGEITRKGELDSLKDALHLMTEKWQTEKSYREQIDKLTRDSLSSELDGIRRTSEEAKRKYSSLLPLIEKMTTLQKKAWGESVQADLLKTGRSIYERRGDQKGLLSSDVAEYQAELDKIGSYLKEREGDLALAGVIGGDVDLIEADLNRLRLRYVDTFEKLQGAQNALSGSGLEGVKAGLDRITGEYSSLYTDLKKATEDAARSMKSSFAGFFDVAGDGFMKFGDLAQGILKSISRSMAEMMGNSLTTATAGGVKSLLTALGFANGGVVQGGFLPFQAFATGGIAAQPTLGLIGEGRYNEAVVPLPDGKSIPVSMQGQSDVNVQVVVNNNTGQEMKVSQSDARYDKAAQQWVIDVVIDGMQRNVSGLRDIFGG